MVAGYGGVDENSGDMWIQSLNHALRADVKQTLTYSRVSVSKKVYREIPVADLKKR